MAGTPYQTRARNVGDLREAARQRLADADAFLDADRHASAIALGLYALEIELKVLICVRLDTERLPALFQNHDREGLLLHTGLSRKIRGVRRPRFVASHWGELARLPPPDRYRYGHDPSWDGALAVRVLHLLRDPPNGVIPWLKEQGQRKA